jgi:hypothetical protein
MAIQVKDVEFTDDLSILGGDFRLIKSDEQHVEHILRTWVGHWKEFPLLGVGVDLYRSSSGQSGKLKTDIVSQLTNDGYLINNINVNISNETNQFFIDFTRVKNGTI